MTASQHHRTKRTLPNYPFTPGYGNPPANTHALTAPDPCTPRDWAMEVTKATRPHQALDTRPPQLDAQGIVVGAVGSPRLGRVRRHSWRSRQSKPTQSGNAQGTAVGAVGFPPRGTRRALSSAPWAVRTNTEWRRAGHCCRCRRQSPPWARRAPFPAPSRSSPPRNGDAQGTVADAVGSSPPWTRRARKYGIGVPLAMSPSKPHQFQPDT